MEIGFTGRFEAENREKEGVFEGKIGVFGVKKGQKWASLFTVW